MFIIQIAGFGAGYPDRRVFHLVENFSAPGMLSFSMLCVPVSKPFESLLRKFAIFFLFPQGNKFSSFIILEKSFNLSVLGVFMVEF
jgi:hypothetical protein